jgi:hypothetical protein
MMQELIGNMSKGKTANDSKMEMALQKSVQTIQELTKRNK